MKHIAAHAAVALVLAAVAVSARAAEVRLNGATTVVDRLVNPYGARVEKATGHSLVVVGNATGKGLVDLVSGRCDAALASEPLDIAVIAAKAAGKEVDASSLRLHVVAHDEIVFIVNPANPVRNLTWEQLRDIHTGKITNWREVGGKDQAITVYTDAVTGGTRAMVKQVVLGGADYGPGCVALAAVKRVADMVAADPSGVGGIGKGFVDPSRCPILATKKLERPLGFVTVGEPSPTVRAVIDAFEREVKAGGK